MYTTGSECIECRSTLIYIAPSWTFGANGIMHKDRGWHGPFRFLPERYLAPIPASAWKDRSCLD